ncbi:MAG: response regulator [Bacteroidetes bacterium]|nr:response regulator [Bacteroidota bacterium]
MNFSAPFNNILLLDDTDVDLFISKKIIEAANFAKSISSFRSGSDALLNLREKINTGHRWPDLCFVDVRMPEMDGFEFISKAGALAPKNIPTKFILITSELSEEIKMKAKQHSSIYKVLRKPFTIEDLQTLLPE